MSKQVRILDNIESAGSLSEKSVKAKSNLSSMPRKYKVLLLVAGLLAAFAVGVLIVVAVGTSLVFTRDSAPGQSEHAEIQGDPMIDRATREQLLKQVVDSRSIAKRQAGRDNMEASCYSIRTNKTHPAAHISGKGFKWTGAEPGSSNPTQDFGYQTSWVCANKSDAFVDGGMYFNQKLKQLHVPICGYYYVSSHVFFQSEVSAGSSDSKYVRHQLRIDRNCSSLTEAQNRVMLLSYSSFPHASGSVTRTTTNIGDVVKLCAGGYITVEIPEDRYNPCCPYGRRQSTYLSAFMVSETSCDPSVSLNHPPTPEDYD